MTQTRRPRASAAERTQRDRVRIAQEAARLMSEHGIRDYRRAISKAAARLGITGTQSLPRSHELEDALRTHQHLFLATSQPRVLRQRREAALAAMQFLLAFDPRLVGAVLDGTADAHSAVCLHVFSDDADAVNRFLHDHGVPVQTGSRRLRIGRSVPSTCPVLLFTADGIPFDLTVLSISALHQAPQGDTDERPMRRATLSRLQELLAEDDATPPAPDDGAR